MDHIRDDRARENAVGESDKVCEQGISTESNTTRSGRGCNLTVKKPGAASSNQCLPVVPYDKLVGNMAFNRTTTVESGVEHADSEVKHRERPDTSNSEAHSPHGAVVRLVTSRKHN